MISITDIPMDTAYQGYLWMSNVQSPKEFHNETIRQKLGNWPDNLTNPFIIEGNLYNDKDKLSYKIQFTDGEYIVNCFDLNNMPKDSESAKEVEYLPNRMDGIGKLTFKEFWIPEPDEECGGMPVLKPGPTVFVGFKYKEEKL